MSTAPARLRPLRVAAWVGFLAGAIALLTVAGQGPLGTPSVFDGTAWAEWAAKRDAAMIVVALLRAITLAAAWYLLGATLVRTAADLLHSARLVVVADLLTIPVARRVLQGALGAGLATASLTVGSAQAVATGSGAPVAAVMVPVAGGDAEAVRVTDDVRVMRPLRGAPSPPGAPQVEQLRAAAPEPAPAESWIVRPGDHFWAIAEQTLATSWGRRPSESETLRYWERLVEANRDALDDRHNPDLIRPGQRFVLPEVPRH